MSKIKMVVSDTFSATSVRAEPLRPGDEFEIGSEAEAKALDERRLARRVGAADRRDKNKRATSARR